MTWTQRLLIASIALSVLAWEYHTIRSAGFVFQDATWTETCRTQTMDLWKLTSLRGFPRTGALASWCGQLDLGQSAFAFHLVNLGLHIAASALVGALVAALVERELIGWVVGALFMVHPLAIESAAYLAGGRGELLAAIGVLLACLCALSGSWLGVGVSLAAGLLGKESAIVILALVPLVLATKDRIAPLLVAFAGVVIAAVTLLTVKGWFLVGWPWSLVGGWALLQATAAVRLSLLVLVPIGQTPLHDYRAVPLLLECACAGVLVAALVVAWRVRMSAPLVACGLAWIVLALVPRLLMPTPPSVLNEHQFYVPLVGFAFLLADRFDAWGMA